MAENHSSQPEAISTYPQLPFRTVNLQPLRSMFVFGFLAPGHLGWTAGPSGFRGEPWTDRGANHEPAGHVETRVIAPNQLDIVSVQVWLSSSRQ